MVPAATVKVMLLQRSVPVSSLSARVVRRLTAVPEYAPSSVSKVDPWVVTRRVPDDGAVQRYHTDARPPLPPCPGSPVSRDAPTVVPETLPVAPVMSCAPENGSLPAAWALVPGAGASAAMPACAAVAPRASRTGWSGSTCSTRGSAASRATSARSRSATKPLPIVRMTAPTSLPRRCSSRTSSPRLESGSRMTMCGVPAALALPVESSPPASRAQPIRAARTCCRGVRGRATP